MYGHFPVILEGSVLYRIRTRRVLGRRRVEHSSYCLIWHPVISPEFTQHKPLDALIQNSMVEYVMWYTIIANSKPVPRTVTLEDR